MQIKIFNVSGGTVRIELYENGTKTSDKTFPALLFAQYNAGNNFVSVSSHALAGFVTVSEIPGNIEIDGTPQTDGEQTAALLNSFLGNFNSGSASPSTTELVLSVTKSGLNGEIIPAVFSWITGMEVKEVPLPRLAASSLTPIALKKKWKENDCPVVDFL
jgi:hypothetical protein